MLPTIRKKMTDDRIQENLICENQNHSEGCSNTETGLKTNLLFFHWLLHFSLFALVVLAVGVFFQIQLIALQQELASLKLNLSSSEDGSGPKNVRKRSSSEGKVGEEGGMEVAHLLGAIAFQQILTDGLIGPWSASSTNVTFISLKKMNTEIEISQTGIYYIYAQIFYLIAGPFNTFQILSYNGTEERKYHQKLATCTTQGRSSDGYVTCFTAFTGSFHSGQRLYLNQVESNRLIHFINGRSYFGVILLKKNSTLKPKT